MDLVASLLVYKALCLAAGTSVAWMGYRLFVLGVFGKSGEVDLHLEGRARLLLKRAAPGTLFCVLGAVLLLATVFSGFSAIEPSSEAPQENNSTSVSGLGDVGRDRFDQLRLAQSINAVSETLEQSLGLTQMSTRAISELREARRAWALHWLGPEALKAHEKFANTPLPDVPGDVRTSVEESRKWLDAKPER